METTFKLYNGITNYVHYLSYLLGDSKANPKGITEKDNITLAKLSLIQNFFLLNKREVVDRKGNLSYSSKVIDEYLEDLVDKVFPKVKNGFLVGGEILNRQNVVRVVRNKFAHGEYYVDLKNNTIVLKTLPNETIIPIQRLNDILVVVSSALVNNKNTNSVDKIIIQYGKNNSNVIRNKEELISELENVIMRKYTLKSTKNKRISDADLDEFNKLINVINGYFRNGVSFEDILESYKKSIAKKGLVMVESRSKFFNKDIGLIINILLADKSFYNLKDYRLQKKKINEIMIALKCPEYNSDGLMVGTAKNMLVLNGKDNSGRVNGDEFLSALISEFLVLYRSLLDSKYREFDFSKLNLDKLKPSKVLTFDSLLESERKGYENYRKGLSLSLEELRQYQEAYYSATSRDKKDYMLMKITLKEYEIKELHELINKGNEKLSKLYSSNPKDIENRKIIEGMINSIIYGNVIFRKNLNGKNLIRDYVIVFKLKDDFELNITVENFLVLFRGYNLDVISKHLEKQEKAKKKVRK